MSESTAVKNMFLRTLRFAGWSFKDECRQKSIWWLTGLGILLIFLARGCFNSKAQVNGQSLQGVDMVWYASVAFYHVIASFGILVAALLSARAFRRDREDGTLAMVLSGEVSRWEYALGRIGGLWLLCSVFTLMLHMVLLLMAKIFTGGAMYGLIPASLLCSLNILFMVGMVSAASLFMADFAAIIVGVAVAGVSLASDTAYAVMSGVAAMQSAAVPEPKMWQMVWPKLIALQHLGTGIMKGAEVATMPGLHPAANIGIWTVVVIGLLVWRFAREEIK
jgi:ABC-type transport system involved in multi-copper enzyme maturation permease subunit